MWAGRAQRDRQRRMGWARGAVLLCAVTAALVLHSRSDSPAPAGRHAGGDIGGDVGSAVGGAARDDVGNARPVVLRYDGRMVRRCQAIAVYPGKDADRETVRAELHAAAARLGLVLTDLPPGVLSAATLQAAVPAVVGCLPEAAGASGDAARLLAIPLSGQDHNGTEPVLTHDLGFDVKPTGRTPGEAAAAIDVEGILADELGRYDVESSGPSDRLTVLYTGALLSDSDVEHVRAAIARGAGTTADLVTVRPRSPLGVGVDMATEPQESQALGSAAAGHRH